MSRTTLVFLMLLMGSVIAFAEISEAVLARTKVQLSAYEGCVVGHAKSFAGSPDSTESIVKSGFGACAPQRRVLGEALMTAGVSSDKLVALLDGLDQQVSGAASAAIVEERASH